MSDDASVRDVADWDGYCPLSSSLFASDFPPAAHGDQGARLQRRRQASPKIEHRIPQTELNRLEVSERIPDVTDHGLIQKPSVEGASRGRKPKRTQRARLQRNPTLGSAGPDGRMKKTRCKKDATLAAQAVTKLQLLQMFGLPLSQVPPRYRPCTLQGVACKSPVRTAHDPFDVPMTLCMHRRPTAWASDGRFSRRSAGGMALHTGHTQVWAQGRTT